MDKQGKFSICSIINKLEESVEAETAACWRSLAHSQLQGPSLNPELLNYRKSSHTYITIVSESLKPFL